jgi:hypothetical protein
MLSLSWTVGQTKRPGVRARRNKDRSDGVTTLKDMRHNKEYMLKDQNGKQKDGKCF